MLLFRMCNCLDRIQKPLRSSKVFKRSLAAQETRGRSAATRGMQDDTDMVSGFVDGAKACHLSTVSANIQARVSATQPESQGGAEGESRENDLKPTDASNETAVLKACTGALEWLSFH